MESKSVKNTVKVKAFLVIWFKMLLRDLWNLKSLLPETRIDNKMLDLIRISEYGTKFSQNGKYREDVRLFCHWARALVHGKAVTDGQRQAVGREVPRNKDIRVFMLAMSRAKPRFT